MKDKNKLKTDLAAEKSFQTSCAIPEWQMELGIKELPNIADGNTLLVERLKKVCFVVAE